MTTERPKSVAAVGAPPTIARPRCEIARMANPAAVTMMRMANRRQHRRTALLNAVMMPSIYFCNGGLSGSGAEVCPKSAVHGGFTAARLEHISWLPWNDSLLPPP